MHMLEKLAGKPQGVHLGAPQRAPPGAPGASESQGVSWTMQKSQDMLYHPFTMMISGPTCKLMLSQLN